MSGFREMYFHLMHETERALQILEEARQACEEMYLSDEGPVLRLFPAPAPQEPPENPGAD